METQEVVQEGIRVHGMFHVHIVDPDGSIVGDSGWQSNQVTNLGFNKFLIMSLGSIADSLYVSHMALGTGGEPAAADTALDGEVDKRQAVTAATSNTSKTLRFTATFASANSFVSVTYDISNIGLFNSSSTGTLFAGNTFNSSSCATNQSVNCTYDITFA